VDDAPTLGLPVARSLHQFHDPKRADRIKAIGVAHDGRRSSSFVRQKLARAVWSSRYASGSVRALRNPAPPSAGLRPMPDALKSVGGMVGQR
jgi:hypothetical protein